MNSQAGWYWIAVGVFALGLTNNLANDGGTRIESLLHHSVRAVQEASDRIVERVEPLMLALADRTSLEDQTFVPAQDLQKHTQCTRSAAMRRQAVVPQFQTAKVRIVKFDSLAKPVVVKLPKIHVEMRQAHPVVIEKHDDI